MSTPHVARAARWYAQHGWPVFPLRPGTKEPYAGIGVYHATTDTAQVADWWAWRPQSNIGLHPGPAGLLALDLDSYKECYEAAGLLTFAERETLTSLTGAGGTHLLYETPCGTRFGNATGALPAGVDLRGWGGYIVLPPSVHPNGRRYMWEAGYGPHECGALALPGALAARLHSAGGGRRTVDLAGPADVAAVEEACATVEAVLQRIGLAYTGRQSWGSGRKWILTECPFAPAVDPHESDRAAFVAVLPDGRISAGCHHARCRARLRTLHTSGWCFILGKGWGCG